MRSTSQISLKKSSQEYCVRAYFGMDPWHQAWKVPMFLCSYRKGSYIWILKLIEWKDCFFGFHRMHRASCLCSGPSTMGIYGDKHRCYLLKSIPGSYLKHRQLGSPLTNWLRKKLAWNLRSGGNFCRVTCASQLLDGVGEGFLDPELVYHRMDGPHRFPVWNGLFGIKPSSPLPCIPLPKAFLKDVMLGSLPLYWWVR